MTPEEKAKELVHKMNNVDLNCENESMCMLYPHAIECALIAVDEMRDRLIWHTGASDLGNTVLVEDIKYWEEVKTEIQKL